VPFARATVDWRIAPNRPHASMAIILTEPGDDSISSFRVWSLRLCRAKISSLLCLARTRSHP